MCCVAHKHTVQWSLDVTRRLPRCSQISCGAAELQQQPQQPQQLQLCSLLSVSVQTDPVTRRGHGSITSRTVKGKKTGHSRVYICLFFVSRVCVYSHVLLKNRAHNSKAVCVFVLQPVALSEDCFTTKLWFLTSDVSKSRLFAGCFYYYVKYFG